MIELELVKRQSKLLNHRKDLDDRYCVMMSDGLVIVDTERLAMKKAHQHTKEKGATIDDMHRTSLVRAKTTTLARVLKKNEPTFGKETF